jgi:hypothetical protein
MGTTTDNSYTKTLIVDATAKDVFHALSEPDAITSVVERRIDHRLRTHRRRVAHHLRD